MTSISEGNSFGNYFLEDILEWIQNYLVPEDVFTDAQLEDWAIANGYVEGEE